MKRILVLMSAALLLSGLAIDGQATASSPETFEIDNSHSAVMFRVKHLGVSYSYGRFNKISGSFVIDESNPGGCSFHVEIKSKSIDSNDNKRDKHLRSPDFFDAKQFPVISFASKSVTSAGSGAYTVDGTLNLRGISKPLTVKIEHIGSGKDLWGGYRAGFESTFVIKRSDFGMNYMPEGLGDEVTVIVSIEGIRKG